MTITYGHNVSATADAAPEKRAVWPAIRKGFRGRCPNCGEGKVFQAFLKVAPTCNVCGEDFSGHRADDLPPYITIVIVGHVVVTAILYVFGRWEWPTSVHLAVWLPLTLIMSLALLQPIKGAVVGLQWALRMHGFERTPGGRSFGDPEVEAASGYSGSTSPAAGL